MNTTIYYFTGTGNSLLVARDIAAKLENAETIRICRHTLAGDGKTASPNIGIVTPVYFSGLPAMVKDFLEKLPIARAAYIFAVATYGESPGIVFQQIKKILAEKGLRLASGFGVQMPHNIHPTSPAQREKYGKSEKEKTACIAASVKNQEVHNDKTNRFAGFWLNLNYNLVQRGDFDQKFRVADHCTGCAACAKVCPAGNIEMKDGKPQWLHQHQCQLCVACLQWCPKQAIQYGKAKMPGYHHPDLKINDLF
jgi:ferredoxin